MRSSFSSIRARVERLAAQVGQPGGGCPVCRGDQAQIRFCHELDGVSDGLGQISQQATCPACGRTYALDYVLIRHELIKNGCPLNLIW